ncbi:cyclic AMP-dependent transcription factor ATF-3 isoform X2 [Pangasianodon hypophthalmus]|uniref:cyclic AMP-dependent transcription factor ATF-3 isoform X2 n=1 Tax=Pangasianodon hypophthalmus TaxID=310915 RepID=UPI002307BC6F|nr:cyclic AMP-dependent transcription factor ATF-3 isoform X2 [Pangasianodon hypophthalmus]
MMLQHPGLGPSEISASALVPCLSPPGSLTLDDFTHFSPLVKEELRYAIQSKRLSSGMSTASSDRSGCSSEKPPELLGMKREESEKLESLNAELKAQIEELKNQKQQLVYMLNLHRPTCIVRAHNGQTPEDERNLFIQQIKETTLQCMNFTTAGSANSPVLTTCDHL